MDKLSRIEIFIQVVEMGSFSAASDRLGITRAAASKAVSQLEKSLGDRLLNRTTRHVSTTESGAIYFQRCKDIIEHLEDADDLVAGLSGTPRGTLRISAPSVFSQQHLTPLLGEFRNLYPAVNIDLNVSNHFVDLVDEGYDLAIRISHLENSDIIARRLTSCNHVLVGSPDYLENAPPLHTPDDLKNHSCILYSFTQGAKWPFIKDGVDHSIKVEPVFVSNHPETILESVINGIGVTILPTFIASEALVSGKLKVVLQDYETLNLGIYVVYLSRQYLPLKVRVFVDFLLEKIHEPPYWDVNLE